MDCLIAEGDLVPFHFGTLGDDARSAVEAHLGACPACLVAYFDVKRAVERKAAVRPSPVLQTRLRQSVIDEVRPRRLRFAPYAAVAACVAIAVGLTVHRIDTPSVQATAEAPSSERPEVQQVEATEPRSLPPRFGGPIDSARDPSQRLAFF